MWTLYIITARQKDAQGFDENLTAARTGGKVAKNARIDLETEMGTKVITKQNYLDTPQKILVAEDSEDNDQ